MVRNYTDLEIINRIRGLKSFKGFPLQRYIVGIRSNEDKTNTPDDKFYIFEGERFITMTTGTTNPGSPILEGGFLKYNKVGAAVVKANECYYDLWKHGYHMGKMEALVQVNPIIVFRDGDKDGKSEEIGTPITGLYGINFHTMDYNKFSKEIKTNIGNWSAGCQVINDCEKYYQLIPTFRVQKFVTYFLLQEF